MRDGSDPSPRPSHCVSHHGEPPVAAHTTQESCVSKNVAVFVDVANIFYAAKAAGVDIDYVTLLKSATAGRDFVRAYAYTGLDPENENQRQFHAFLGRSGYKVVSKDIRKYGDGRIKANLDIELVVDMMRMGDKLDIAVVISGDGDFAPAIAAVQQMGVRVEVISFRGNTSSDLIDVADTFIDITTVAKVEKGVRSGRRVATDGDLSMTEVPDKESGVTPRRRRRRGDDEKVETTEASSRPVKRPRGAKPVDTEAVVAAAAPVASSGVPFVAMPGEKLSRGIPPDIALAPVAPEAVGAPDAEEAPFVSGDESTGEDASGRRRRRRRGGRGRGRGGRSDEPEAASPSDVPLEDPIAAAPEAVEYPDEVPTLPQHSGFGSVWDSQIGTPLPGAPVDLSTGPDGDEDLDAEPEVPEYLLAEKRQQGRRPSRSGRGGSGGGRQGGGYRSAIDRERYGSGSRSNSGSRARGDQGNRLSSPTPPRRPSAMSMEPIEQTRGGDPWSEVPPDVQALLKAELARREASTGTRPSEAPAEEATPKTATRRKPAAKSTAAEKSAAAEAPAEEAAPKKATRRKPAAKSTAAEKSEPEA
jgi:uncharacterized LabA/DUF88 family protein